MTRLSEQEIRAILENFRQGKATDAELALLESWYLTYREEGEESLGMVERMAAVDEVWLRLEKEYRPVGKVLVRKWYSVAAAVVVALGIGAWFLYRPVPTPAITVSQLVNSKKDIPPAANRATLAVAGGGILNLDSSREGIAVNNGDVRYEDNSPVQGAGDVSAAATMLTLQTPKGGTYRLTLPDSSVVWLNAASRLVFPSTFKGRQQRLVTLSGEAYFEVAKNREQPFVVKSRGQQVEVLGTHFNINCYDDETFTKTTLLEGRIRVGSLILQPGEQAVKNETGIKTILVNTEEVTGWKNNYIVFQEEKIQLVMRKISRWYDMEVEYEGELPTDDFSGRISNRAYVSQVLRKLELTNKVHFKIAGRKIIVTR